MPTISSEAVAAVTGATAGRAPSDPDAWPSQYDLGPIGNQHTVALVSRFGAIEWACLPHFESPSVFARLLDRRVGGFHSIAPAEASVSHQAYVASTNLLETIFELSEGRRLTVTDFMPVGPHVREAAGDPRIVRRLEAVGGPVDVEIVADPRFNYGRDPPAWDVTGPRALATSSEGGVLALTTPWDWLDAPSDRGLRGGGTVEPGRTLFAQVRWGEPPELDLSPEALYAFTDSYWRSWVSSEEAPLRRVAPDWQAWIERSELVLKLLSHAQTGVFIAAPTTSLPEWVGSARNWDYRYVWLRDAGFTAQVFLLLGHLAEARSYVAWALERMEGEGSQGDLRTVYGVRGSRPPPEVELEHLEGYRGSRPVRIGNAASEQNQHDIFGEVLDSALMVARLDPGFVRDHWPTLSRLAGRALERWNQPDSGIWEFRTAPAHYVHSKLMCWVALVRAIELATLVGRTESVDVWRAAAQEIQQAILAQGFDEERGAFVQAFDHRVLDASALRIPLVGFLPFDDDRVQRTMKAIEAQLSKGPHVYRYAADDGLGSPEGSFLLCSFWMVECLARSGRTDAALERWNALLKTAGPLRLFAEEYDPLAGRPLGNYPQAFTHIGLLRAALALGLVQ